MITSFAIILQEGAGGAEGGGGFAGNSGGLIMIAAMVIVMYFFMIRPQQKKQKELKKFRESLAKGTEVVTSGGIYGKIIDINGEQVVLEIDRGVKMKVLRSAITSIASAAEEQAKTDSK